MVKTTEEPVVAGIKSRMKTTSWLLRHTHTHAARLSWAGWLDWVGRKTDTQKEKQLPRFSTSYSDKANSKINAPVSHFYKSMYATCVSKYQNIGSKILDQILPVSIQFDQNIIYQMFLL